ncbi:MAG TPA: SIS domain-containing protein [Patescibacteria group bacterium]|nr:SIS domain-containing protein [Patescibacteria group bacterium]
MKSILDNQALVEKLDQQNMRGSIRQLDKQISQVWAERQKINLTTIKKRGVKQVVVAGMGGSTLGMHVLKSVFAQMLSVPVEVVNDYTLPAYVDKQTLVLASSYSGSTEEVLSAWAAAEAKQASLVALTSGGRLADLARQAKKPLFLFNPEHNPCRSPRMGLGYMLFGQLAIFSQLGLIKVTDREVKQVISVIKKYNKIFGLDQPSKTNPAKKLALLTPQRSVWYLAAEHLIGSAHVAANQLNENGKRFGGYFALPELNHHLLEGLLHPVSNQKNVLFILLSSVSYCPANQRRVQLTKELIDKNKVRVAEYAVQEKRRLDAALEVLVLSSYLSYYAAILTGIDPTAIPFVDQLKKRLARR